LYSGYRVLDRRRGYVQTVVLGTKYSLECIAEILLNNKSIRFLNFSKNRLGDSHLGEIGEALKINSTLSELDISQNYEVTDKGLHEFLLAVSKSSALKFLKLTVNAKTAPAIVSVLEESSIYFSLDLSGSNLNKDCIKMILKALEKNISVTELNLNQKIFRQKESKLYIQYHKNFKTATATAFAGVLGNN
jgi:hypothetical protein